MWYQVHVGEDGMSAAIAVLAGVLAFLVAFSFDWVAMKRTPRAKLVVVFLVIGLHGYALYAALWGVSRFWLPTAVSVVGWVLLPIFAFLLLYSLVIELPSGKTYYRPGVADHLVTTGTYALTRHPGVMWYILALVSLLLATRSTVLLIAVPVWSLLDIIHVTVQDRFYFVKMFPGYRQYQQQTPMLIPTRQSLVACLLMLRRRPHHVRVGESCWKEVQSRRLPQKP